MSFTADGEEPADDTKGPIEVTTRELAEGLINVLRTRKQGSGDGATTIDKIYDSRDGVPPSYDWKGTKPLAENSFLNSSSWRLRDELMDNLATLIFGVALWFGILALWNHSGRSDSQVLCEFISWVKLWAYVPTSALLAYVGSSLTAMTLITAVLRVRGREPYARIEQFRAAIERLVNHMPVRYKCDDAGVRTGDWTISDPGGGEWETPAREMPTRRDEVLVANQNVQFVFWIWLISVVFLLVPCCLVSLQDKRADGWIAGLFAYVVAASVVSLFNFIDGRAMLNRAAYFSGTVFAEWSLVKVALDTCPIRQSPNAKEIASARTSSDQKRGCACCILLAVIVVLLAVIVARILGGITPLNGGNASGGSGWLWFWFGCSAIAVTGLWRWTCAKWLCMRVNRDLRSIASPETFEERIMLGLFGLATAGVLAPVVLFRAPSGWHWLQILVGLGALAVSHFLLWLIGWLIGRRKGNSSATDYIFMRIRREEEFKVREIQRRIEQSLDQLAESYKSTEAKSPSTEGSEEDHSTNRAKKQTVDSVREFIICKGDTRCLQRQHGADEQGQGTAPKDANETQRL
ncbi:MULTISPECIES: hypothetical protein [unclassified Actinobaculum]|uniref:hypothetical protein n=1 Tax=unclassified Actinobaculum TaxID=2609299 RepID=UPI000D52899B|nr:MULTISPECIES: hypothetical protein [unclassified Actinobaculum]AWE42663.1 hypothetical protein DDD63_07780 [Actinobaculum sp. 313]RTE49470.1 hypothetical protein EKN07_05270 [Actinobaculum sp. 352]